MQVSVENVGTLGRKLTLKIPADNLDSRVNERITQMGRTVRLKGFRPGRVPPQVIRQRFGDQVRGEILSDLIGESLREAFEQEDLRPVAQPTVDTTGEPERSPARPVSRSCRSSPKSMSPGWKSNVRRPKWPMPTSIR